MTAATILAFHGVEEGSAPLCIRPEVFERQVAALAAAGAEAFTVSQLMGHLGDGSAPRHAVAFTFDDGYRSVHSYALPILAGFGYTATVFPVTGHLGGTNAWDAASGESRRLVSSGQLLELAGCGWEVGSHTHTHRRLVGLCEADVRHELETSAGRLGDLLGKEVHSFAYPYGAWDSVSRRQAGSIYRFALGIGAELTTASDPADLIGRVDAWYLRQPWQLRYSHRSIGRSYLAVRRLGRWAGSRARRS